MESLNDGNKLQVDKKNNKWENLKLELLKTNHIKNFETISKQLTPLNMLIHSSIGNN